MRGELNLLNQETSDIRYKVIKFPDGHKHIDLRDSSLILSRLTELRIRTRIVTFDDMFLLLQVMNAVRFENRTVPVNLIVTYLMAGRYDRRMYDGDSHDLEIVADLINGMGFVKVGLIEPHSNVTTTLIKNSYSFNPLDSVVVAYLSNNGIPDGLYNGSIVMVAPDLGAVKRTEAFVKNSGYNLPIIYMNKKRDIATGQILGTEIMQSDDLTGKMCVLYDDLCDGGRTFIEAAKVLRARGVKHVLLAVVHGIFSQGLNALGNRQDVDGGYIDTILTTNSYMDRSSSVDFIVYNVS